MTNEKQTKANQRNSTASTGPKTAEGLRTSSRNALKHGLFCREILIDEKEKPLFAEFADRMHAEFRPQGPSEVYLVTLLIDQCWRLKMCLKIEKDLFDFFRTYQEREGDVGVAFAHDASQTDSISRLSRYAARFERGICRTLAELRKVQTRVARLDAELREPVAVQPPVGATSAPASAPEPVTEIKTASVSFTAPFGGFAKDVVLQTEDLTAYEGYAQALAVEWQATTTMKAFFIEWFAATSWRLSRLSQIEACLFQQYRANGTDVTAFVTDATEVGCFPKLSAFEARLRTQLSRSLKELLA